MEAQLLLTGFFFFCYNKNSNRKHMYPVIHNLSKINSKNNA